MQRLNEEQQREVCLILSVGCGRDTAARYVGCTPLALAETVLADAAFARDVARAEAGIELAHMRSIQQAARDERHWRASMWWLERRAPDQYARRGANVVTAAELRGLVQKLGAAIAEEVTGQQDRHRLLQRLEQLALEHEACGPPAEAGEL